MNKIRLLVFLLTSLTLSIKGYSQGEASKWVFGQNILVDFSGGNPAASVGGIPNGVAGFEGEGFASLADKDGTLLMFTDGTRVFNGDGTAMTGGTGLKGGLSSMQSAVIVPKPGSDNEYYVFTASEAGGQDGVNYSLVTYNHTAGTGVVTQKNTSLLAATYSMEALTVVPHFNGTDSWVIAHGAGGSNEYYAYQVSAAGVNTTPVTSAVGQEIPLTMNNGSPDGNEIGMIKSNSCFTQLAIADLGTTVVEVLDFDNSTGQVGPVTATMDGFTGSLYGLEFSPDGQLIYTTEYVSKKLSQFDITGGGDVTGTKIDLGTGIDNRLGQLQQGPDGKIYIAGHGWSGKTHLGVIELPNVKGTGANVNFNEIEFDFAAAEQMVTMGLPQFSKGFIANVVNVEVDGASLSDAEVCVGTSIKLGAQSADPLVSYSWDINNGATTYTTGDPSHTFNTAGDIPVELTVTDQVCGRQQIVTAEVKVNPIATATADYKDATASRCEDTDIILEGSTTIAGVTSYKWFDAQTGGNLLGVGAEYTYNGSLPYTVWIEPTGTKYSAVGGTGGAGNAALGTAYTKFSLTQKVTLTSVDLTTYTWGTCGNNTVNYEIRQDDVTGAVVASGSVTFSTCGDVAIDVNTELAKGTYYLVVASKTGTANIDKGSPYTGPYTGSDNIITVEDGGGGPWNAANGPFKNFVIQEVIPCTERTEFEITDFKCCKKPASVTVSATDEELCTGDNSTLSFNVTYETGDVAGDFNAFWVKGSGDPLTATPITNVTGLTKADAETYTYVVVDKANPTKIGCADTASVTLKALDDPTTAAAGSDVDDLCTNEYDLGGNALATGETGKWTVVSGSGTFADDTNPTTKVTGLGVGDNVFKWTITNACGSDDDDVKITRLEPISGGTLAPLTLNICANTNGHAFEVTGITGTNPQYNWTMPTNVTQNGAGPAIQINVGAVTAGTSDKLLVSVTGDCPGSVDLEATLNWNAKPDLSNASIKDVAPVCVNNTGQQTFELEGVVGTVNEYGWLGSDASNPGSPIIITSTINPLTVNLTSQVTFTDTEVFKTVTISVQAENDCGTSDDVVTKDFEIDNLPSTASLTEDLVSVCINDPISLTAETPKIGVGTWTKTSTDSGDIDATNNPTSTLSNLAGGAVFTGTWTVANTHNNVCPTTSADITVQGVGEADPSIQLTLSETAICEGESVTLTITGNNHGDAPVYDFLDNSDALLTGSPSNGTATLTITPTADISVKAKVVSNSSCLSSPAANTKETTLQTITVSKKPSIPTITAPTKNPLLTCGSSVNLEATATIGTLVWTVETTTTAILTDNGDGTGVVNSLESGKTITLKVTSSNGTCTSEESTTDVTQTGSMTQPELDADQLFCETDPLLSGLNVLLKGADASASPSENGKWSIESGSANINPSTNTISNLGLGENVIIYSVNNGVCDSLFDKIKITIDEEPSLPTFAEDTIQTCSDNVTLAGTNPNTNLQGSTGVLTGTWLWSVVTPNDAGKNLLVDASSPTSQITSLSSNGSSQTDITLKATITNGKCSVSDQLVIEQVGTIPPIIFTYKGDNYTDGIIESTTLNPDNDLCKDNGLTVTISGPDANHTGVWALNTGSSTGTSLGVSTTEGSNSFTVDFNDKGDYVFDYSLSKKGSSVCPPSKASITFKAIDRPDAPISISPLTSEICATEELTFTASSVSNATSYSWDDSFGLSNISTTTSAKYKFEVPAQTGTVTVFSENECGKSLTGTSATVKVVAPAKSTFPSLDLGDFCFGTTPNLELESSIVYQDPTKVTETYTWLINGSPITENAHSITGSKGDVVTLTVIATNAVCTEAKNLQTTSTASYTVIKPSIVLIDEKGDFMGDESNSVDKYICLETLGSLLQDQNGSEGNNPIYTWSVYSVPVTNNTSSTLSLNDALIEGLSEKQTVTVTKKIAGCPDINPITIDVYPIPEVNPILSIQSDRDYLCVEDEKRADNVVELFIEESTIPQPGVTYYTTVYEWNEEPSITGNVDTVTVGGIYTANVYHKVNGSSSLTKCGTKSTTVNVPSYDVKVEIDAIEAIDAQNGDTETFGTAVSLTSLPTEELTYKWYNTEKAEIGEDPTSELTLTEVPYRQYVHVIGSLENTDCSASDSSLVLVFEEVAPPNVFTPNGDDVHDTWVVPGLETYPDAVVTIYNRWGNVVYQIFGGYEGDREWNGRNQNTGGEVTVGAYYYVIELNVEGREQITGHINVIR